MKNWHALHNSKTQTCLYCQYRKWHIRKMLITRADGFIELPQPKPPISQAAKEQLIYPKDQHATHKPH